MLIPDEYEIRFSDGVRITGRLSVVNSMLSVTSARIQFDDEGLGEESWTDIVRDGDDPLLEYAQTAFRGIPPFLEK